MLPCCLTFMRKRECVIFWVVIALLAIAGASIFDRAIAVSVQSSGIDAYLKAHRLLMDLLKLAGEYYFVIAVAGVMVLAHPLRWRAGGFVLLATGISGINGLIKWMVGRTRPFKLDVFKPATHHLLAEPYMLEPFRGGLPGLFHGKNLSFPSGHTALAFATAAAVAMLWPRSRWRWVLFAVAVVVAAERIAENAHWLSDTVAGAALGIGGVYLIQWVLMRFFPGISEQHDLEVMVPDPESTATEQPLPAHK
jgi:membrane-associated phospholipid phosphatase